MSYFNTTHETGATLAEYEAKASTQEGIILLILQTAGRPMTPTQIHRKIGHKWPITSVRRALSVLVRREQARKTNSFQPGPYRRREHKWEAV